MTSSIEVKEILKQYAKAIDEQFLTGIATEHSYRPALQKLLSELLADCVVINEPARIKCGAPDFIITYKNGCVWINDSQYFGNVPEAAWNAYIGGYQPAQKWLKDRKGRSLSFDDIFHYHHIIYALTQTQRLMSELG